MAGSGYEARSGRSVIAAIGVDRYAAWPRLTNAVSDARGALELFGKLGFEPLAPPLLDEEASGDAIRKLVADDLRVALEPADSLVLFFAGHGYTRTSELAGGKAIKTGYIIGADGVPPGGSISQWVRLDTWLSDVARLPAHHILVILDACRSGIALDALVKHRDVVEPAPEGGVLDQLRARRSRRVITSALDDQRALDSGPVPGHSLFTGYLIEGLTRGIGGGERRFTTGSELGLYLQRQVSGYPSSEQTPDFGALELDDRGELVLGILSSGAEVAREKPAPAVAPVPPRAGPAVRRVDAKWARALLVAAGLAVAATLVMPRLLRTPADPARVDAALEAGAASDARAPEVDAPEDAAPIEQPPGDGSPADASGAQPPRRPGYSGPCRLETHGDVTIGGANQSCPTLATPAATTRARVKGRGNVPRLDCKEVYQCR
jgi:uncharacterized caspase-like protein